MPSVVRKAGKKSSKTAAADHDAAGPIKYAKRPMKPFIWFNLQHRPLIARATGLKRYRKGTDKAQSLEAAVSDAWRSLTPEQRAPYTKLWREDQERFQRELDSGMVEKPKKVAPALPLPKRVINAFAYFQRDHRTPGICVRDKAATAEVVNKWKALSPEERSHYKDLEIQDKERMRMEMKDYKAKVSAGFGTALTRPRKTESALVFFQRENKSSIDGGRGLDGVRLHRESAKQWKALSPEERKKYEDLRDADKQRYQLEMDEYVAYTIRANALSPNAITDVPNPRRRKAGGSKPRKLAKRKAGKKLLALPAP
jgi:mRNA-degrading endonuclease RelE of RelBE toxin-antitoxin system